MRRCNDAFGLICENKEKLHGMLALYFIGRITEKIESYSLDRVQMFKLVKIHPVFVFRRKGHAYQQIRRFH